MRRLKNKRRLNVNEEERLQASKEAALELYMLRLPKHIRETTRLCMGGAFEQGYLTGVIEGFGIALGCLKEAGHDGV
jgi:hypothetical protein